MEEGALHANKCSSRLLPSPNKLIPIELLVLLLAPLTKTGKTGASNGTRQVEWSVEQWSMQTGRDLLSPPQTDGQTLNGDSCFCFLRDTLLHRDKETNYSMKNKKFSHPYLKQRTSGPHNLRSFLIANSTQNYFLIAHVITFLATFVTKGPYLTFCDKMRQFLINGMVREGGNKEKMRKCRE